MFATAKLVECLRLHLVLRNRPFCESQINERDQVRDRNEHQERPGTAETSLAPDAPPADDHENKDDQVKDTNANEDPGVRARARIRTTHFMPPIEKWRVPYETRHEA